MPSSRLRELLAAFDAALPLERAATIPAPWFTDPELADLERSAVFADSWQAVGRADQVAEPGSFLTADVAGEPVLVVRDQAGTLRAFANVCRHKGTVLLAEPCGHASKIRCRYHGWTYDLAGKLRGTPEFDGVENFRREDNGLPELAVGVWGPIVWVHAAPPREPLEQFLTPMPDRTSGRLNGLKFAGRREYELACNWKVFVDNYLDGGYHVNTVHPELAGVLDYSQYRVETFARTSVQTSPLVPGGSAASVRSGDVAMYWWVYPNFMLNLYEGVMDTNLVLPIAPNRCRVVFDFYFARTEGPDAERYVAESIAVAHRVQMEDAGVCEDVQRGLGSRTYTAGRFSVKREAGGYHFHRLLAERLRAT
jgi:choline monooxygenase